MPDDKDKADIFAASLLISYFIFFISNLIFNSHDFIIYYFKRFFLSLKGSFDGKVLSLTKNGYGSVMNFL